MQQYTFECEKYKGLLGELADLKTKIELQRARTDLARQKLGRVSLPKLSELIK